MDDQIDLINQKLLELEQVIDTQKKYTPDLAVSNQNINELIDKNQIVVRVKNKFISLQNFYKVYTGQLLFVQNNIDFVVSLYQDYLSELEKFLENYGVNVQRYNLYRIKSGIKGLAVYYLGLLLSNVITLNLLLKTYSNHKFGIQSIVGTDEDINIQNLKSLFESTNNFEILLSENKIFILKCSVQSIQSNFLYFSSNGFKVGLNYTMELDKNSRTTSAIHNDCDPGFTEKNKKGSTRNYDKFKTMYHWTVIDGSESHRINTISGFDIDYYGCVNSFGIRTFTRRRLILHLANKKINVNIHDSSIDSISLNGIIHKIVTEPINKF